MCWQKYKIAKKKKKITGRETLICYFYLIPLRIITGFDLFHYPKWDRLALFGW